MWSVSGRKQKIWKSRIFEREKLTIYHDIALQLCGIPWAQKSCRIFINANKLSGVCAHLDETTRFVLKHIKKLKIDVNYA